MPVNCEASGCTKREGGDKSIVRHWIRFYRLPKDQILRSLWLDRLDREEKDVKDTALVCSDHFHDTCFDNILEVRSWFH